MSTLAAPAASVPPLAASVGSSEPTITTIARKTEELRIPPSVVSLRPRQHHRRRRCHGVVVTNETPRLRRIITAQIVRPTKPDRLVPQLTFHMKWPLRAAGADRIRL